MPIPLVVRAVRVDIRFLRQQVMKRRYVRAVRVDISFIQMKWRYVDVR